MRSTENNLFAYPAPDLRSRAKAKPVEVRVPISYTYNGGTLINGVWYGGYEVPAPIIPDTHELVTLGVGLQLNARPPYATMLLRPKGYGGWPQMQRNVAESTELV